MDLKAPTNRRELNSFIGLANFSGRFIHQFSKIIEPLNHLRKQNIPFIWTHEQDRAFHKLKLALSSKPVIQPFDVNKDITLTTDASEKSIAGILMQEERPVIYFSRRLTPAEQYSNIEREALACMWCMERVKQFLLGTKFLLQTDHYPLEFLFNQNKALPKTTNARILRWALK